AVRRDQVLFGVVGAEEVEGGAGALAVGGVRAGGVRRAVAEEGDAAGGQLQVNGPLFGRGAADVVIAVGAAAVLERRSKHVGDDLERAVGDGGVVDGDPHSGAH